MHKPDLVGVAEIEERHGIPRYRVRRLLARGLWPQPLARLALGDVYDGKEVADTVANLRARQIL